MGVVCGAGAFAGKSGGLVVGEIHEDAPVWEYGPALKGKEDVSEENIAVTLPTGPATIHPPPILQDIPEDAYNLGIGRNTSAP